MGGLEIGESDFFLINTQIDSICRYLNGFRNKFSENNDNFT